MAIRNLSLKLFLRSTILRIRDDVSRSMLLLLSREFTSELSLFQLFSRSAEFTSVVDCLY